MSQIDLHIAIQNWKPKELRARMSMDEVRDSVYKFYRVPPDQYKTKSRRRSIVEPRQVAMYFMRLVGHGCLSIGRYFDLDHTTILYSNGTVKNMIETDEGFKSNIELLKSNMI